MTSLHALIAACVVALMLLTACTKPQHATHADRTPRAGHSSSALVGTPGTSAPVSSASNQSTSANHTTGCPDAPTVSDAAGLTGALLHASAGDTIVLAPGVYRGHFTASATGTAAAPITVCGPRTAVLDGGGIKQGYVLHLSGARWWRLHGFTVQDGQKGVMLDRSGHNVISGLAVHGIGDEAIHLRDFSSDNTVENNDVSDTGRLKAKFGEGIYVGTANHNWCTYSDCKVDNSDRNLIRANTISNTTAENIDIKEGTSNGVVQGNHLSGVGMDPSAATAWVNVKGNGWTIEDNIGVQSVRDGFQVHQVFPGWGENNVFRGNQATVDASGWGYYVQNASLNTVIACSNVADGAGAGTTNSSCQ